MPRARLLPLGRAVWPRQSRVHHVRRWRVAGAAATAVASLLAACSSSQHHAQSSPRPTSAAGWATQICTRLDARAVMRAAGGTGPVTTKPNVGTPGDTCEFVTDHQWVSIIVALVDKATAEQWRTDPDALGKCSPIDGLGVWAVDCHDSRGVSVYLPANYLISVSVETVPIDHANNSGNHAEALSVARAITPSLN